jgi:hypothetical protein
LSICNDEQPGFRRAVAASAAQAGRLFRDSHVIRHELCACYEIYVVRILTADEGDSGTTEPITQN